MSKIIWIASYPKSGNTWVRFLASNLVFGPVSSAADLARLAPDLHELGAAPPPPGRPTLMKTHFPYSDALPLAAHTAGAIYVVRDPADVMLSNFHYARRSGAGLGADADALDRYLDAFIEHRGDPRWIERGMGSWEENVRSWLAAPRAFPVMRIRYEDLQSDAARVAAQLCRALGCVRTAEQIDRAVNGASFERLREIEEADIATGRVGIFYKPYLQPSIDAGLRFMRAGNSGDAAGRLSGDQWRRFITAFGALRGDMGYV